MKYLLDTNVLSESVKTSPHKSVLKLTERHQHEIVTAAPVWHELFFGCQRLPVSRKREILETFLHDVLKPNMTILPYDERAAEWHAKERARLTSLGQMPSFVDGQIAAIAKVNGLILVTRNTFDFKKIFRIKIRKLACKMKNIAILGSTGSIGTQTLDIVERFPDRFNIISLVAHRNVQLLSDQIKKFQPEFVVMSDESNAEILAKETDIKVFAGEENIVRAATDNRVDMVINSLVGKSGLLPTIEAIKLGKEIGLANKETLVLAGNIVMQLAKKHNVSIIPIDSEHSALFQSLRSGALHEIHRLVLTMGKGPIAGMDKQRLSNVTMQDVLDRPFWDMGMKINVDSATCVNKAFEVIEARWLFDVPAPKIDIVVHPQYLCHSLVEFKDGSIICELGTADMKRYTQYALFYPDRGVSPKGSFIDLFEKPIAFEKPPFDKFPCLGMGHYVIEKGGTMPAVFHGADTTAVRAFMGGKIKFTDIPVIIQNTMDAHEVVNDPDLAAILDSEKWAEEYAKTLVQAS